MGRYSRNDSRYNILAVRFNNEEMELINSLAQELGLDKSKAMRKIIFEFAFKLDPEKVKKYWKEIEYKELKEDIDV